MICIDMMSNALSTDFYISFLSTVLGYKEWYVCTQTFLTLTRFFPFIVLYIIQNKEIWYMCNETTMNHI